MIQRIQTIYLFLTFIAGLLMLIFPFAEILLMNGIVVKFYCSGLRSFGEDSVSLYRTIPLIILVSVTALISMVCIFLYKKRHTQLRFCIYNMLILAGLILMIIFYFIIIKRNLDIKAISYSWPLLLPMIMLLFSWQALRGINKDEFLVNSADRLR